MIIIYKNSKTKKQNKTKNKDQEKCEQIHMYPSAMFVILNLKKFVTVLSSPAVSVLKHQVKQQLQLPDIM